MKGWRTMVVYGIYRNGWLQGWARTRERAQRRAHRMWRAEPYQVWEIRLVCNGWTPGRVLWSHRPRVMCPDADADIEGV
jgi:hypothetical protein